MSNKSDTLREEHVAELVAWLEQAAAKGNTLEIMQKIKADFPVSAIGIGYDFSRIDADGILELKMYFPFDKLSTVIDVNKDIPLLQEWFEAVVNDQIKLTVENHNKFGQCAVTHRYYHIPEDKRDSWLGDPDVAPDEQKVLKRLLGNYPGRSQRGR